jgi:putative MFS transporter
MKMAFAGQALSEPPGLLGNPIDAQADISARIERLPITRQVFWTRNIIGAATFFDGYTVIAIA